MLDVLDVQDVVDVDYQVDALDTERKQITESLITGRRHLQFAREMGSHRVTHMHTYIHKHKYTHKHMFTFSVPLACGLHQDNCTGEVAASLSGF